MLISGTSYKSYNSNKPIIARLIISEFIEGIGGWTTAMLLEIYDRFGGNALETALKGIGILVGIPQSETTAAIDELGGIDEIANILRYPSSGGLEPQLGYRYVFSDSDPVIPAGQYSLGAIWQENGKQWKLDPKNNWTSSVDWIAGVPNISWIGEWQEVSLPSPALEAAFDGDWEAYEGFLESDGTIAFSPSSKKEEKVQNLLPWILAGVGYFVGGIVGAPAGFVAGQLLSKQKDDKPSFSPVEDSPSFEASEDFELSDSSVSFP